MKYSRVSAHRRQPGSGSRSSLRRTAPLLTALLLTVLFVALLSGCAASRASSGAAGRTSGTPGGGAAEQAAQPVLSLRLTRVSGARVRTAPNQKADETGRIPLATVLEVYEQSREKVTVQGASGAQSDYWYRIRAEDGLEGWIFGGLTLPYAPSNRLPLLLELYEQRLGMEGASFTELADLQNAIERTQLEVGRVPEWFGLELSRLQTLRAALNQVPLDLAETEPYGSWLRKNDAILFRDEIQGAWLMRSDKIWELEPSFRGTAWGDALAWFAAGLPLGGECEGYLVCVLEAERFTQGRYLDAYPRGQHAQDALHILKDHLSLYLNPANGYEAQGDNSLVVEAAERLRELVFKTQPGTDRDAVLKLLEKLVMKYAP